MSKIDFLKKMSVKTFLVMFSFLGLSMSVGVKAQVQNSVGLDAIVLPVNGVVAWHFHPVNIIIRNVGTSNLDSCYVNWSIDGIWQWTYFYKNVNGLPTGFADTVTIGTFVYPANNAICAWVSLPNGAMDSITSDDSACVSVPPYIPATGMSLNWHQLTMNVGDTAVMMASFTPSNATNQIMGGCMIGPHISVARTAVDAVSVYANSAGVTFFLLYGGDSAQFVDSCIITITSQYKADISGSILRQDSTSVTLGFVNLYKLHPGFNPLYYGSVPVDSNGTYLFSQVEEGSYLIQFFPDSSEQALPTYYGNTEYWYLADTVIVADSLPLQNIDIMIIPLQSLNNGNSFISGYVGGGSSQKSISQKSVSDPAENVNVYLQKEANSVWKTVAYMLTNAEGYFEFKNIPAGRYKVVLDVVGLEHIDNPQIIDVNDGDTIQNIAYEITENGIENKSGGEETGIVGAKNVSPLRVFPNPATGQLTIDCRDGARPVPTVEIYSVVGQRLNNYQLSIVNYQLIIDVSHLASGMYFLKIGDKVTKFVKE